MFKISLFAAAVVLTSTAVLAGEQTPNWPLTGADRNAENVKAAYQTQCGVWADNDKLQGDKRADFVASCQKDMAQVWPLGLDAGGGGGEG